MKFSIILGTRPEIIKLSPIIRYLEENNLDYFIIHTNQHYSKEMDEIFFKDLNLPIPRYNLNIGSGTHGYQTGLMLQEIEKVLIEEKPTHVFVQGDTNTVMAGALAASKLQIKVCHIEAGLRSYDREMPEEINRIVTDSISDYLFVPTTNQEKILLNESISQEKIFVTGNTIVDAVFQNLRLAKEKSTIIKDLNLDSKNFFLLTLHRPSNVDNSDTLINTFQVLEEIYIKENKKFIFPIHPRTKNNMDKFNIKVPEGIKLISPVGYLDMLSLISNSLLVFTDSGGIQEEACILNIPSITLRENTERPETIEVKSSLLVGSNKEEILKGYQEMLTVDKNWKNPFGDGTASSKIFDSIK